MWNCSRREDAPAALKILENRDDIDLIFTDVVLPGGLSGHDLSKAVARSYPRVKVLITSGFADEDGQSGDEHGQILKKPYALDDLEKAIVEKLKTT